MKSMIGITLLLSSACANNAFGDDKSNNILTPANEIETCAASSPDAFSGMDVVNLNCWNPGISESETYWFTLEKDSEHMKVISIETVSCSPESLNCKNYLPYDSYQTSGLKPSNSLFPFSTASARQKGGGIDVFVINRLNTDFGTLSTEKISYRTSGRMNAEYLECAPILKGDKGARPAKPSRIPR